MDPTDIAAFEGEIAPARSTGTFWGAEWGFAFGPAQGGTERGWAQVGRSRNGVFL